MPSSDPVTLTTAEDEPAVSKLKCEALNASSLLVSWRKKRGTCPSNRTVVSYVKTNGNVSTSFAVSMNDNRATISRLSTWTMYNVSVQPFNALTGPISKTSCRTGESVPATAPRIIKVDASNDSVAVSWNPVDNRNGIVLGYRLNVTTSSFKITETTSRQNATVSFAAVVSPYASVNVALEAYTTAGYGPASTATTRTPQTAPGGPPTNIVVADETPTSLTVRWAPPSPSKRNGLIVAYRLEATSVNDYKTIVVPWFVLAYRFDNLRHRTLYLIDVSAATAGGFGPTGYYVAKTKNGNPSCPRNVTAHPILKSIAGSIELRWTWTNATSATDPESKPTGFLVRSSASGSCVGAVRSFDVDRTATNATLEGLRPYTVYNVCLVAVNGKFRRVCAERTTRTHTTQSAPPSSFRVVETSHDFVSLAWRPPSSWPPSWPPIVRYAIRCDGCANGTRYVVETSVRFDGLEANSTYGFAVAALTAYDELGKWSDEIRATTAILSGYYKTNNAGSTHVVIAVALFVLVCISVGAVVYWKSRKRNRKARRRCRADEETAVDDATRRTSRRNSMEIVVRNDSDGSNSDSERENSPADDNRNQIYDQISDSESDAEAFPIAGRRFVVAVAQVHDAISERISKETEV
ncbi:protein sidekick-1-like [Oscarella lobularis]|uniref:protein sidekick-1-like n=1 Tax=Oscarella lobularis TaxID=121494 RepID=UPI003313C89A